MSEIINIFHSNYELKGTMERQEAHQNEEWHETFQCIFTYKDNLILQKRSITVADYKGKFDITVGGHLLSTETVEDGVREIEEEMGLNVTFERLNFLCTIPEELTTPEMIDKEFINIYTLEILAEELKKIKHDAEVEALIKVHKKDFYNFCLNHSKSCSGYEISDDEEILFTREEFLPYSSTYFECLGALLNKR
ncbi:NUDIX hydrolase [Macrococcoides bohemicum]|uniref:NUDIX hydrolase n=1 Tax=Macrococcoides bohemicum TaxID=1903056 RepID=UPI003B00A32C